MWGGIYAVLFSISTLLSFENPIKNGFQESLAEKYTKFTLSEVEFQNKVIGKEIQYSFYDFHAHANVSCYKCDIAYF